MSVTSHFSHCVPVYPTEMLGQVTSDAKSYCPHIPSSILTAILLRTDAFRFAQFCAIAHFPSVLLPLQALSHWNPQYFVTIVFRFCAVSCVQKSAKFAQFVAHNTHTLIG